MTRSDPQFIPDGWVRTTLGEPLVWGSGGTPRATEPRYYGGGIPWAVIGDLNDAIVTTTVSSITDAGLRESSAKWVRAGSVLVAMYGSIGKLGMAGVDLTTNQAIAFADPTRIDPRYLFWYLMAYRRALAQLGKGGTQRNISQEVLKAFPFLLAPLAEQHRIVAAIEEHLSRLDAAVAGLKRVQELIPRYRAAVLKAAVEGRLSSGDPQAWEQTTLGDLVHSLRNGIATKPAEQSGQPILRISAVRPLSVDLDDVRFLALRAAWDPYVLESGDLLFTRYNGNPSLVGACGMVPSWVGRVVYPDKLIRARLDQTRGVPAFIQIAVSAGSTRRFIQSKAKTTAGQAGISGADLRRAPISLPRIEEQFRIAGEVERRLSLLNAVEHEVEAGLARADRLRQSILKRAFEGKLVAQDPHDEPASVLLERIRASRAAETGRPQRTRQRA